MDKHKDQFKYTQKFSDDAVTLLKTHTELIGIEIYKQLSEKYKKNTYDIHSFLEVSKDLNLIDDE